MSTEATGRASRSGVVVPGVGGRSFLFTRLSFFLMKANTFYDLLKACTDSSLSVGVSVVVVVLVGVVCVVCRQRGCVFQSSVLLVVLVRHTEVVLSSTRTAGLRSASVSVR